MKKNNSVMKCCVCNNTQCGEFITIEDKKYHLCCITNLQRKNEQLKEEIEKLNSIIDKQDRDIVTLSKGNKQLKERINKAMEYIKGVYEMASYSMSFLLDKENIEELEEILKGGSNE